MLCTPTKKTRILVLTECGAKPRDIASEIGINVSTVRRQLKKLHQNPNPYYVVPGRGRKRALNERDIRRAAREITSGNQPNATALQRDMFPELSPETMRRYLREIGLNGRVRRKKPMLRRIHKRKRRDWAEEHEVGTGQGWSFQMSPNSIWWGQMAVSIVEEDREKSFWTAMSRKL